MDPEAEHVALELLRSDLSEVKADVKKLLAFHNQELGRRLAGGQVGNWVRWLPTFGAALFTVAGVVFAALRS